MSAGEAVQRLRIGYRVAEPLQYLSVLDMGRLWERLLRRARLPLAYTQGYHPHARMQFAAPLPVGYTSDDEWLDVYLRAAVPLDATRELLAPQCPRGLTITSVGEAPLREPSLQARVHEAAYRVHFWSPFPPEVVEAALEAVLARDSLYRTRERKGRVQQYDLKESLRDVVYVRGQPDADGEWQHLLHVRARAGSQGGGRPEELLEELGLEITHRRICRTRLFWEGREET